MNLLAVALAHLCFAEVAYAETPRIVNGKEATVIPFPGHDVAILIDHRATAGGAAVLELQIPPNTFGAPPHVHANEDEHFYVLEGSIEFLDRDRTVVGRPGTLVVLPRGHLHGFWNATDEPARLLAIVTPGEFASFFDEVVEKIRSAQPKGARAVGEIINRAAAIHGVQVYPDKVPEAARHLVPR